MSELSCNQVQDVATEYALGILPRREARRVSAHVLRCRECREESSQIRELGDRLLDLVPDAEPPLGFDQKVLATLAPRAPKASPARAAGARPTRWPTRMRVAVAAAAAAVAAAAGITASTMSGSHHSAPAPLAAAGPTSVLREGGRDVGSVYVAGSPPWLYMTVKQLPVSGSVTCQVIGSDGSVSTLGSFQVVHGTGSWGAPAPAGSAHLAGAQVLSGGKVLARATFARG